MLDDHDLDAVNTPTSGLKASREMICSASTTYRIPSLGPAVHEGDLLWIIWGTKVRLGMLVPEITKEGGWG